MKVLKFGGTSVGSAQRMKDVAKLITGSRNIIVLSAMSGTTNSLVEISEYLYKKNPDGANEIINQLAQKYDRHVEELFRLYPLVHERLVHVVRGEDRPVARRVDLNWHDEPLLKRMWRKIRVNPCARLYAD